MDNDAKMLEQLGTALTSLQIKYRANDLAGRVELKPALDELLEKYSDYQSKLLNEGVITSDADLAVMKQIKQVIDGAAQKQELAAALARTIAFVATKMV